MTLDCPFRNPLQSRVISVRSCYLTSYGYLHFYQIRFTACSIQQLEFSLATGSFAVITTFHPQMWGPLGWVDSVFAVWYLPLGASCLPVRRSVTLGYPEEFSWTANLLKLILNPSWSMAYWSLICCSRSFGSWSFSSQRLPDDGSWLSDLEILIADRSDSIFLRSSSCSLTNCLPGRLFPSIF